MEAAKTGAFSSELRFHVQGAEIEPLALQGPLHVRVLHLEQPCGLFPVVGQVDVHIRVEQDSSTVSPYAEPHLIRCVCNDSSNLHDFLIQGAAKIQVVFEVAVVCSEKSHGLSFRISMFNCRSWIVFDAEAAPQVIVK